MGQAAHHRHLLTSSDFVPVPNGSEYIKEKGLKFLTFLRLESGSPSVGRIAQPWDEEDLIFTYYYTGLL